MTGILEQPNFKMKAKKEIELKQMLVKYEQRTLIEEGLKIINS